MMEAIDNKVCIVRDKDTRKAVSSAIELLGGIDVKTVKQYPSILVKPNLCGGVPGEPGSHTSIEVLKAVLEVFSTYGSPLYIGEADCSFNDAHEVFTSLRVYQLGKQFNAQVINLSEGPSVEVEVPKPLSLKRLRISTVLQQSFIVSVPVLKTHPWCAVTMNMKNMYGAIYAREKAFLHNGLEKNIVDINKVVRPHLCILDAKTAVVRGGFKYGLWVGCPPTTLDLIIAGMNPVSVDAVGTRILGKDPCTIRYLELAAKQGLGICDLQKLNVVTEGYVLM
ncbi:MAG TPA: DUF362 domain-containing protein [Thermodesulfobacteriota bacterium]|nr:DUF362 domain-containing protein [Thermodesulfobacteriota bacterium]